MTDQERMVYEAIPIGEENGIRLEALVRQLGIAGRRVRAIIENLNYNQKPVCNLRHGYFRPATVEELDKYIAVIGAYRRNSLKKDHHLKKARESFDIKPMEEIYPDGLKPRRRTLQGTRGA